MRWLLGPLLDAFREGVSSVWRYFIRAFLADPYWSTSSGLRPIGQVAGMLPGFASRVNWLEQTGRYRIRDNAGRSGVIGFGNA